MYSVSPQLCLATITVSIVGYPLTWMTRVLELYTIKKRLGLLLLLPLSLLRAWLETTIGHNSDSELPLRDKVILPDDVNLC